jgi:predicted  nucleic acid-binding Zn-ribbon protein
VKSTPSEQRNLLDLQGIDLELVRLNHQAKNLPILAELAKATRAFEDNRDLAIAAATQRSDIEVELLRSEADVEQVVGRIEKDQKLLDSGTASPKDLENLIHELGSLNRRKEELEEIELEIMVRIEECVAREKQHTQLRDQFAEEVTRLTKDRDEALVEIDTKKNSLNSERARIANLLAPELLALYLKISESNGGIGAAALKDGRCEGCHLQINTVELERIKGVAEDEVIRCEECRRILVRV